MYDPVDVALAKGSVTLTVKNSRTLKPVPNAVYTLYKGTASVKTGLTTDKAGQITVPGLIRGTGDGELPIRDRGGGWCGGGNRSRGRLACEYVAVDISVWSTGTDSQVIGADGSMFSTLLNYADEDYCAAHPEIILETEQGAESYLIAAIVREKGSYVDRECIYLHCR